MKIIVKNLSVTGHPCYHAVMESRQGAWAAGKSPMEALGDFLLTHGQKYGFVVVEEEGAPELRHAKKLISLILGEIVVAEVWVSQHRRDGTYAPEEGDVFRVLVPGAGIRPHTIEKNDYNSFPDCWRGVQYLIPTESRFETRHLTEEGVTFSSGASVSIAYPTLKIQPPGEIRS